MLINHGDFKTTTFATLRTKGPHFKGQKDQIPSSDFQP